MGRGEVMRYCRLFDISNVNIKTNTELPDYRYLTTVWCSNSWDEITIYSKEKIALVYGGKEDWNRPRKRTLSRETRRQAKKRAKKEYKNK